MERDENIPEEAKSQFLNESRGETKRKIVLPAQENRERLEKEAEELRKKINFRELKGQNFPSKFDYYPVGTIIKGRPLFTTEIKHYSTLDEDNPLDIDKKINETIKSSTQIILGGETMGSYKDLVHLDKLHLFLTIRDITMDANGKENKITFEVDDPKKEGYKRKIELSSSNLGYYKIPEGIMKHYSQEERCFIIKHEKFNKELRFYIPTIGVTEYITEYALEIRSRIENGENIQIDETFIKLAQFMVKDWRLLDKITKENKERKYLKKLKEFYNSFNEAEHQAAMEFMDRIKLGIKPTIDVNFGTDAEEDVISVPITFRKYKSLLYTEDIAGELFQD